MDGDDVEYAVDLAISEDLVPQPIHKLSTTVSLSFSALLEPPLLLRTNQTKCGGQLWPAGMVLAEYLLRNELSSMNGKVIVELGAGSGLVGLAIALGLSRRSNPEGIQLPTGLYLTDGLSDLIPLLEQNTALNSAQLDPGVTVSSHVLSWGGQADINIPKTPDVILAADCAYLEETFPLLTGTLEEMMGERTVLWFCYKKRRKRDKECIKMIGKVFCVSNVRGDWEKDSVFLFKVRRREQ